MTRRPLLWSAFVALAVLASPASARAGEARLLRFPDIHGNTITFSHGGDLWTVPASGGVARRLTSGEGLELFPRFSPDGKWIAFTGQYDGTSDVYVVPAAGGEPRRLTWYPSRDLSDRMGFDNMVVGWTPDGKVLFRGMRGPMGGFIGEPWVVSPEGGPVERFPLPEAGFISFAPDAKRIAYTRIFRDFRQWKRYAGGLAQDVWIHDLGTGAIDRITDWRGTDTQPMWIGNSIYFLSDRDDWKVNLWRFDVGARAFTRVTRFQEYDVKWAHDGSGKIVFENGGYIYSLDPADGVPRKVSIELADDERHARKRWVKVDDRIDSGALSPDGKRAVFSARGDVFTAPAEHGDVRNLSRTPGAREKDAVWSPDGHFIAYWSDATGEEELYVAAQDGKSKPTRITSGPASWHFKPVWSPDSTRLAYADRGMRLWWVSVTEKKPVPVAKAPYREIRSYSWSPDSRWIAFASEGEAQMSAVYLYSVESKTTTQVTADGWQSTEPVFDPEGKYLYLLGDRDVAPTLGQFEQSYTVNKVTRPHAITLRADLPSPFAPQSDEVKPPEEPKKEERKARAEPLRIDLAGMIYRIVPFPVAPGNLRDLAAVKGKVFWVNEPTTDLGAGPGLGDGPTKGALVVFDLDKRKATDLLASVGGYDVSRDGTKVLYRADKTWAIAEPKEGMKPGEGALKLDGMRMELDPRAEWAQIFRETWRLYRDFFYLSDMGKVDWVAMRKRYEPLVAHVSHRHDLTYVLAELVAELGTGHTYVGGGDYPHPERVGVGTLGADLELDRKAGRWRIARILPSQPWIEARRSPLLAPGVKVAEGEYLLAIDGQELKASDEPYRLLAGTAGRTIALAVSARPSLAGAREVSVQPLANEWDLRYFDWVETNRRKVEKATGGKVAYVHIPDMGPRGLTEFIRQFYSQVTKQGLIVDVRANGGGFASEMILERLRRKVMGMSNMRDSKPFTYPAAAFNGPMVALANMYSASDGDIFPHFFRAYGLGPIIGQRTWGGVVGVRGLGAGMADGGYTFVPEFGMYDLKERWIVENEGVRPDIEVDNLPGDELAKRDPQLERAIQEVMAHIAAEKPGFAKVPAPRDLRVPTWPSEVDKGATETATSK
jgi:tricorn protease